MRTFVFAAVLSLAGCVSAPDVRGQYECAARLQNEDGEFIVTRETVRWTYDMGGGVSAFAQVSTSVFAHTVDTFRADGLSRVTNIVFSFPRDYDANHWQTPGGLRLAVETHLGPDRQQTWLSNDRAVFTYPSWSAIESAGDGVVVLLYTVPERATLLRAVAPHATLARVEPTLRRLADELAEMESDAANRCTFVTEEVVIVT